MRQVQVCMPNAKGAEHKDQRHVEFEVLWRLCRAMDPTFRLFCCAENKPLLDQVPVVCVFSYSQMQPPTHMASQALHDGGHAHL